MHITSKEAFSHKSAAQLYTAALSLFQRKKRIEAEEEIEVEKKKN